ncbi:MAG: hypothetical protein MUD14_21075 [Hydrococcus sp. Prado102]|jgi:hypothetical protein|nr:hypothetical protein [Hydrococcus sp. Prado102]
MHVLTEAQYKLEAEPILRKIFINDYPFGQPFSPNIIARRVIYPCYNLEQPFLEALTEAATKQGDIGCYLSVFWQFESQFSDCYILLSELFEGFISPIPEKRIEIKLDMLIIPEYILYSAQGKWGLMISDEHHGLLGGSSEFIEVFYKFLPDFDNQAYNFLERMQDLKPDGSFKKLDWLSGMLAHVYGQEAAKKMLQEMESINRTEINFRPNH